MTADTIAVDISYPGTDGIHRVTAARLTTDHAASSYGLPVVVVDADDDQPLDPEIAHLIDAIAGGHGIGAAAGTLRERLPAGVYGPADLPPGASIHLAYQAWDTSSLDAQFRCYDAIDALGRAAQRAGYTVEGLRRLHDHR